MAVAEPPFLKTFKEHYPAQSKADCTVCHVKPPQRNPFGKLIEAEMIRQKQAEATVAVMDAVAATKGSDGKPLLDAIQAGKNPADLVGAGTGTSGTAAKVADAPAVAQTPPDNDPLSFIPKHTFHPAVVHFPVALYIFALFLELYAWKFKKPEVSRAALWAMVVGLVTALGALATGLVSLLRQGYGFSGTPLYHLLLAITATICVAGAAWLKYKGKTGVPYWILLVLGAALVGLAGHIGSLMVYP